MMSIHLYCLEALITLPVSDEDSATGKIIKPVGFVFFHLSAIILIMKVGLSSQKSNLTYAPIIRGRHLLDSATD